MIFDMQSLFSDHQAITADAASENIIDLGATGTPIGGSVALKRDLGAGGPVALRLQVTEAFATLTSLNVKLEVCDASDFASGVEVVSESGDIPVADLVAGKVIPPQYVPINTNKRYVRVYYDVTGANATAGKVIAGLVCGNQTN